MLGYLLSIQYTSVVYFWELTIAYWLSTKPRVGEVKVVNFIPSYSIDLLDQRKIVLACNIGHVSDISLDVYHLDCHKVLFHYKFLFSIRFFKTLTPEHHVLAIDYSDIVVAMASSNFDTLNVIYWSHTLILLVCLPQIYVHSSRYTLLITRNALKK